MPQTGMDVSNKARYTALERQCTAHSRNGNRCGKRPIMGGTVCVMHGGAAPAAKAAARRRLIELIDPAIAVLHDEMQNAEASRDRIAAANSILDRAGVHKGGDSDLETARAILIDRLLALRGEQAIGDMARAALPSSSDDDDVYEDDVVDVSDDEE